MPIDVLRFTIEALVSSDLVAVAQCIAIDADAFPYASAQFGQRTGAAVIEAARALGERRVIGFVASRPRASDLHIEGIAVSRDLRRRGIGRALLRAAAASARAADMNTLSLHVSVENASAIALYEREGLILRRRLRGFYRTGQLGEIDAYEMVLHLG